LGQRDGCRQGIYNYRIYFFIYQTSVPLLSFLFNPISLAVIEEKKKQRHVHDGLSQKKKAKVRRRLADEEKKGKEEERKDELIN